MKMFLLTASVLLSTITALPCSAQIIAEFHPGFSGVSALPGGTRLDGQTFTATSSGSLGSISVLAQFLGKPPSATPFNVTFQFRTVSGGLPTSTILGSVVVDASGLSGTALGQLSADFSSQHIAVVAGDAYAFLLSSSSTFALGGNRDGYAGGQQVISFDSGKTFGPFPPPQDLDFTASLAASPVPEPGSYNLIGAAGLIILGGLRKARERLSRSPRS